MSEKEYPYAEAAINVLYKAMPDVFDMFYMFEPEEMEELKRKVHEAIADVLIDEAVDNKDGASMAKLIAYEKEEEG